MIDSCIKMCDLLESSSVAPSLFCLKKWLKRKKRREDAKTLKLVAIIDELTSDASLVGYSQYTPAKENNDVYILTTDSPFPFLPLTLLLCKLDP